jgi:2-desacetyl-2-hydroxyethyl bacteriochlorophyllide A dehydrogenase
VLAAIFHGPRDIRVEERPDPEPEAGEALVRVRAAGICGGDLHEFRAGRQLYGVSYPRPPQGHELAGDVVAVGAGVEHIAPGDRVAVMPMVGCGACDRCAAGRFSLCARLEHIGVARSGGFAELCLAPAANLYALPDALSYEEGALLDCTAVAVHALHRVPVGRGERVAVLGAGAIGQAVAQAAKAAGAHITVVGRRAAALALARELGADAVVDLGAGDAPPEGMDAVYETAGGADLLQRAAAAAGPGGRIGLVGETFERAELDVPAALSRELTLAFVWSYDIHEGEDEFAAALELARAGTVRLEQIVTHRFELAAIVEAFETAADRARSGAVKVIVES